MPFLAIWLICFITTKNGVRSISVNNSVETKKNKKFSYKGVINSQLSYIATPNRQLTLLATRLKDKGKSMHILYAYSVVHTCTYVSVGLKNVQQ